MVTQVKKSSTIITNYPMGHWYLTVYCIACSAGVFFERAICSRKRHVETSLAPTVRVTISTLPNLPLS